MNNISAESKTCLKHWRHIAMLINEGNEQSEAVRFINRKIAKAPKGENEEVIADGGQFLKLLIEMSYKSEEK